MVEIGRALLDFSVIMGHSTFAAFVQANQIATLESQQLTCRPRFVQRGTNDLPVVLGHFAL